MSQSNPAAEAEEQAKAVYAQAVDCIKKQDFAGAEKYLTESLNIAPNADAAHNLGTLRFMQGQIDKAVDLFHQAVTLDPHYDAAYANLMRIVHQKGDIAKAIEYSAMAMTAAPEKRAHKEEFITILSTIKLEDTTPDIKRMMAFCLQDEGLTNEKLPLVWLNLIAADPELAPLWKPKHFIEFENAFHDLPEYKALLSRDFILGLARLDISEPQAQTFLNHLRMLILKDHVEEKSVLFGKNFMELFAALAAQAMRKKFKLEISLQEQEWLETLRKQIAAQQDISKSLKPFLILATYEDVLTHPATAKFAAEIEKTPELNKILKIGD